MIFDVTCEGEGVSGPPTVSVGPKTEACYEILYKPTFIGKTAGKVVFVSEGLGKLKQNEVFVVEFYIEQLFSHYHSYQSKCD